MIHIILKNRKVLRYNAAANITRADGMALALDSDGHWLAQIPIDNIERIEAVRPCVVMKAKPAPKRANYGG